MKALQLYFPGSLKSGLALFSFLISHSLLLTSSLPLIIDPSIHPPLSLARSSSITFITIHSLQSRLFIIDQDASSSLPHSSSTVKSLRCSQSCQTGQLQHSDSSSLQCRSHRTRQIEGDCQRIFHPDAWLPSKSRRFSWTKTTFQLSVGAASQQSSSSHPNACR